jgi:hypothetical protein
MEEIVENEEREAAQAKQKKSGDRKQESSQQASDMGTSDFDYYDELVS